MFNVAVLVKVRSDGKLMPPDWPLTPPEVTARLRDLEHHLHCAGGLSIRQTQAAMLDRGIRRSIGMIHRDLHQFECPVCSDAPKPPDPAQRARVIPWR